MSSWANLHANKQRKGPTISSYLEISTDDDLFTNLLRFSYVFVAKQRSAEPMYVYDKKGMVQNLLKVSPVVHYIKEVPSTASNILYDIDSCVKVLQTMNVSTVRKTVQSINILNSEKELLVQNNLKSNLVNASQFDCGIVLDVSGSAVQAVNALKIFQARTFKKTLKIFVMTNNYHYLHEFVTKGDKSWTFASLMKNKMPETEEAMTLKILSDTYLMQSIPHIFVTPSTSVGRYLYLTTKSISAMDSSVNSLDGENFSIL